MAAATRDRDLFKLMRATGVRKKVAARVSEAVAEGNRAGKKAPKAARAPKEPKQPKQPKERKQKQLKVKVPRGRKGLRFHSGLIPDGIVELARQGALHGEVHGGALMGTQPLFDWAAGNAGLRLRSSDYTHGAATLARLERFVAVNSAVEVDFTGQVNGELARGSYVGAVGGALDFVRAANQSPGGVAITVLPAARIVEKLAGPVSVPRSEAGVIVTERGSADLRGCSLSERERRLRLISGSP